MVQINYNIFSNKQLSNYLDFLIGRVFKCLPMKESNDPNLSLYFESLLRELLGNKEVIVELKNNSNFIQLLGKLNYLSQNNVPDNIYRKDIFDSIELIKKIKKEE